MTSSSKERAAECEICRHLRHDLGIDDFSSESFPPAVTRLEECRDLRRCPLCHTFYLMTSESDPHHFMSSETWLRRIDTTTAIRKLASMSAKMAERWMKELDVDAQTTKLVKELESDAAAEAAATMAAIYLQRKSWGEFEALLRHGDAAVRIAAIGAVERSLASMPAGIIDSVATLLADSDTARAAHAAFSQTEYGNKVSPLITTLVDCFDHHSPKVRALAVDLVIHHMDPGSGFYIDSDGAGSYRAPKPLSFGKAGKAIASRLPRLVGHILKPRPARWVKIESRPFSVTARDFPNRLNTRVGAAEILEALIKQGTASKARVRQAFAAQRPQLRKMFAGGGDIMNPDVSLLARDVAREQEGRGR